MFERFTDRARRVVVLAQEESRLLSHNYIGTEHLLLGLLAEREGVAARALESLNVTLDVAREHVTEIIGPGQQKPHGHIPFTPRAKKILELSLRESLTMGSEVIDTEHLLLGLVDEGDGVGAQILRRLGATAPAVREAVVVVADAEPEAKATEEARPELQPRAFATPRQVRLRVDTLGEVKDLLVSIDRRLTAIERHLGIGAAPSEPPAAEAAAETAQTAAEAGAEAEAE
jgi:ATP-dependent Clp protease ATP-binding subunit ClpC